VRLLSVVDRYPPDGGSRGAQWCRELATRLTDRGHTVEVLTGSSPAPADAGDGVAAVHRVDLDVADPTRRLRSRLDAGGRPVPLARQEAWMAPRAGSLAGLQSWLVETAPGYDAVAFFDYGTPTTWAGLPACAGRVATVLHPMAVESAWLRLPLFDTSLRLPSAYAFVDAAEEEVVSRRLGRRCVGAVVGSGGWDTAVSRYERLLWVVQSHP
jgi:hypothetical protein